MLVAAGAVLGVGTVTAIATGYEFHLTPEMVQLLIYKAFGAAAVGLMIAGTWIGRGGTGRRDDASESLQPKLDDVPKQFDEQALSSGRPADIDLHSGRAREHADAPVRQDPTYREP